LIPFWFRNLLPIIGAASLSACIYMLVRGLRIERGARWRINEMIEHDQRSPLDRYGDRLADRLGLSLLAWRRNLDLARLTSDGRYSGWSTGGVLARVVVYGGAALALVSLFGMGPIFWLAVPLAAYLPVMRMNSAANETRKNIHRLLPETATVIAAEMAAGANPDQALGRAAELPGPLGVLLSRAVSEAMQSKRPAFSRPPAQGVVVEVLSDVGIPALTRFAVQLDRVAAKGVEGPRLMSGVARGFAREYRAQVQTSAAMLDNELLMPMTLFFFAPLLAAILLPLMVALFSAFA